MVSWIVAPVAGLIEPSIAPEFFIDTVGAIELIGSSCIRVYYCAKQMPLECVASPEQKIVMVKVVRPLASVPAAISRLAQCLITERSPDIQGGFRPRLVT